MGVRVYPHLLKHSRAGIWVKQGGNSFTLQRILGHSSITTTEKYVSVDTMSLKNAHNQFSPSRDLRA
jgi:integrase/recombinase XerD